MPGDVIAQIPLFNPTQLEKPLEASFSEACFRYINQTSTHYKPQMESVRHGIPFGLASVAAPHAGDALPDVEGFLEPDLPVPRRHRRPG
jgi:hypothetical protein